MYTTDFSTESEALKDFLKKAYNNIDSRIWIYKDKTLVVDLIYKKISFAFDINIKNKMFFVHIVRRNDHYDIGIGGAKKGIGKYAEFKQVVDAISKHIAQLIFLIDDIFKYDISIIIPVYNREDLIENCVLSLNRQTLRKDRFEIIFVDDCSKDNTINVIEELIDKSFSYTVIRRSVGSGNASTPRNEGIKASKSRYILFLDSDDYIEDDTLEKSLLLADKNNSDLVYLKICTDSDRIVPIRPYKLGNVDKADIFENHLFRSLAVFKLFSRDLLVKNRILFNPSIGNAEDKIFMCQVLAVANSFSILADKPYYHLSFHEGEHLSRKAFPIEDKIFILINGFLAIYNSKKDKLEVAKLYNAWLIIVLEFLFKVLVNKKILRGDKEKFYLTIYSMAKIKLEFLDEQQIYKDIIWLLPIFKSGDFDLMMSFVENKVK